MTARPALTVVATAVAAMASTPDDDEMVLVRFDTPLGTARRFR